MFSSVPDWFFLIIASAVCLGVYDIFKKHAVRDNSVMPVLFFATLTGGVFFTLSAWATGALGGCVNISWHIFRLIFLKSIIVGSGWICVYYAMRELPISIVSPIRASAPLWTFVGSLFLFSEFPTMWQALGMAAVFGGYYVFSVLGKREGIIWKSRGMLLIFAGTFLGAGAALYDKYLLSVLQIPRMTMQFWFSMDLIIILGLAYAIRKFAFGHPHKFQWRWSVAATGVMLIIADWLYFNAISQPDTKISILSLLRRCSCVVTFAAGSLLFHDVNVRKKAAALLLILAGVIILAMAK